MSVRSAAKSLPWRVILNRTTTVLAFALVWFVLVLPDRIERFSAGAFLRVPIEGLVLIALCLWLPHRARRPVAVVGGILLGLLTLLSLIDLGFYEELDRPFNPVTDWSYLGPASGVLRDSLGTGRAIAVEITFVLLVLAVIALLVLATLRLAAVTARQRRRSTRAVAGLAAVWAVLAVTGVQVGAGAPAASASTAGLAYDQIHQVQQGIADQRKFSSSISAPDPYAITPATGLLSGLKGKDVVIAFVESYGQVAVQNTAFSTGVDSVLRSGNSQLTAAGFQSRSAFLTSPTFGGISWLAHSTLQSGLWVDNQQRYDQVVASSRFTLSDAFKRAGWRTVSDIPSDVGVWNEGRTFYHYDVQYDANSVGYAGPQFSYARIPDQYTLSAFQRLELTKTDRAPVMAEIDLVSSHTPWTPLPRMVGWNQLGNGSVYDPMPAQGKAPDQVWPNAGKVQTAYGQSIQYSLTSLISWVQQLHDDNLVLIMLGDHQPATIVSGTDADHDVPISVIAHDPAVLDQISSWNWQDGLLPDPQAPVWPMDTFRNKFLTAFDGQ